MIAFGLAVAPVGRSLFVNVLPNFVKTNRRLETIRHHQRHRDMCDDIPSQNSIKIHLVRMRNCTIIFQSINHPQSYICDQKESYELTSRLSANLNVKKNECVTGVAMFFYYLSTGASSTPGIEHKSCLTGALYQCREWCYYPKN